MRLIARCYSWLCERLYHELAFVYDPVSYLVSLGHWDRWRAAALEFVSGATVLELGFGTGRLLPQLARAGRLVIGVDRSREMVALVAHRLQSSRLQSSKEREASGFALPQILHGAAEQLPLRDGSVDTIVSTFPAPYITAPATLAECRRVLRKSRGDYLSSADAPGRLVIVGFDVTPVGQGIVPSIMRLLPVFYSGSASSASLRERYTRYLEEHGFDVHFHTVRTGATDLVVVVAQPKPE